MHPGSDPGTFLREALGKAHFGWVSEAVGRTRVNPEQASKVKLREPIRLNNGEGRCGERSNRDEPLSGSPG